MSDNATLKDEFVAAVFAGDTDALRGLAHSNFELWQNTKLPYGGVYRGAEGFLDFLGKFMATFDIERLENTRTFTSPDGGVVSEFAFKGTVKHGGRAFDTLLIEVWSFSENQVLKIVTYWFEPPF